jgi:hypothetical protein
MQVCEPNSFMYSVGRLSIQNTPSEGSEICRHLTAISNTARTPNILSLVNLLLPSGCTRIYCANDKLSVQFALALSLSPCLSLCVVRILAVLPNEHEPVEQSRLLPVLLGVVASYKKRYSISIFSILAYNNVVLPRSILVECKALLFVMQPSYLQVVLHTCHQRLEVCIVYSGFSNFDVLDLFGFVG